MTMPPAGGGIGQTKSSNAALCVRRKINGSDGAALDHGRKLGPVLHAINKKAARLK
ncbi:MAG TPA: hypothetical protein VGN05_10535 [Parvibaculum sp.]